MNDCRCWISGRDQPKGPGISVSLSVNQILTWVFVMVDASSPGPSTRSNPIIINPVRGIRIVAAETSIITSISVIIVVGTGRIALGVVPQEAVRRRVEAAPALGLIPEAVVDLHLGLVP